MKEIPSPALIFSLERIGQNIQAVIRRRMTRRWRQKATGQRRLAHHRPEPEAGYLTPASY